MELYALIEPHVVGPAGELPGYTALRDATELENAFHGSLGLVTSIDRLRSAAVIELASEP
jgi:hypothetical protein